MATNGDELLIADTFQVGAKIGEGSYGKVCLGTNVRTGQTVAIKFEHNRPDSNLPTEYQFYQLLQTQKGFPRVYHFGVHLDYHVLVMDLLGRNLESVFEHCGRRFSLETMIFLTLQLLKRFEAIHAAKIVYRDVKPENFMLGAKTNTVHVIDLGLSKLYVDEQQQHIPFQSSHELIGTTRYMSINAHMCKELSRRDDLEAVGYMLVYFLRGKLPWSGLKSTSFSRHNRMICDLKRNTSEEELCQGHPEEFAYYLKYARGMTFDEAPNYEKLRTLFKRMFHVRGLKDDGIYDWNH